MVGTSFGGYQIVRKLGQGGMGVVYEGHMPSIGRRVAIKLLHPEYAEDGEALTRFFNEARAANRIPHPAIIQVSEFGRTPSGAAFLVMEFLDGAVLSDYLQSVGGTLPSDQAIAIATQIADALSAAHARGVTHRDLKPGNIMLVADPLLPEGVRIKILDFGLAKLESASNTARHTRSGAIMGTPLYMAPEQCESARLVDGKADVYALGVILFELLSGRPPFVDRTELGLMNLHVYQPAPSLRSVVPTAPKALCDLVSDMLAKDSHARPSMSDVHASLRRIQPNRSQKALPPPGRGEPVDPLGATVAQARQSIVPSTPRGHHLKQGTSTLTHRGRIGLSLTVGALAGFCLLLLTRLRPSSDTADESPSATIIAVASTTPIRQPLHKEPMPPSTQAAVPSQLQLDLDSIPHGATVRDAESEQLLGRTPFHTTLSSERKDVWLLLRKTGYQDRVLHFVLRAGEHHQKLVTLTPARERHRRKSTPRTPLSIEDVKSRMQTGQDNGNGIDIPEIAD